MRDIFPCTTRNLKDLFVSPARVVTLIVRSTDHRRSQSRARGGRYGRARTAPAPRIGGSGALSNWCDVAVLFSIIVGVGRGSGSKAFETRRTSRCTCRAKCRAECSIGSDNISDSVECAHRVVSVVVARAVPPRRFRLSVRLQVGEAQGVGRLVARLFQHVCGARATHWPNHWK